MKYLYIITIIITAAFLASCEEGEDSSSLPVEELEAMMQEQCLVLHEALEEYALDNMGRYPRYVLADTTMNGNSLNDFLPEGYELKNVFTDEGPLPIEEAASSPGEISYEPELIYDAVNGYIIKGYGANELIVKLYNSEEFEETVINNCFTVKYALEEFARHNNGLFPSSGADTDQSGKTLYDYLPNQELLFNPAYQLNLEPSFWAGGASDVGCIGIKTKADRTGSEISCTGRIPNVVIMYLLVD